MRAICDGDRSALAELYDRHARLLLHSAMRRLKRRAEAEDILHDVFLEAWQRARAYAPERGSVRTWLLVRLRSRLLDRARQLQTGRRAVERACIDAAAASEPPPRADDARLDRACLEAALRTLTVQHASVLRLHYFDGLSYDEIAQRIGTPIGTVKSRYSSAMLGMRERLGVHGRPRRRARDREHAPESDVPGAGTAIATGSTVELA